MKSSKILCTDECPCFIQDLSLYNMSLSENLTYTSNESEAINIMGCS